MKMESQSGLTPAPELPDRPYGRDGAALADSADEPSPADVDGRVDAAPADSPGELLSADLPRAALGRQVQAFGSATDGIG